MAKNIIIMIGDGMGWEMARAAAIYQQIQAGAEGNTLSDFYTEGKGTGLSFQNLEGYGLVTTYGTTIADDGSTNPANEGIYNTSNSALQGSRSDRVTGEGEIREGFEFDPTFNPGISSSGGANVADGVVGNLVGYDPERGGAVPWDSAYYGGEIPEGFDQEYIKYSYPDSANTATTLYTGVKSFNGAIGVDIYEQPVESILTAATIAGKSTGLVSSVPVDHATPGAAAANVNDRNKFDEFSVIDTILQQELTIFKPTVLLGGGHPLSNVNEPLPEGVEPPSEFEYLSEGTYNELSNNPTDNIYGYTFLERGANAADVLANTAAEIDPEAGERLLGVYGARGQNGNLPTSSADGDYDTTGFNQFTLGYDTSEFPLGVGDTDRPLLAGETDEEFIATETNENPTLNDLVEASLDVLEDDPDGFWLMIEGGDVDWAAHDNNLDNLIGNMLAFDQSVQTVMDWIEQNGGWEENQLIVTADHDHYLTLNENFPELLRTYGPNALTYGLAAQDSDDASNYDASFPDAAGHFWGSDSTIKHGWTNHSNRPVPVYYQGPDSEILDAFVGKGYEAYGFDIPGIDGFIDQVHIAQTMFAALPTPPDQPAQMQGINGYDVEPVFTVGQKVGDYIAPGILDGLGAYELDANTVRVLANHELSVGSGYTYTLANGTELNGGRVSYFDIDKDSKEVVDAGLAYNTIINRAGEVVDEASDLEFAGISRLCSAQYIEAHQFGNGRGLEDSLFFTGEETSGGTEFVVDPATQIMYAVPWMGRAAWENVTELDTGTTNKVALLIGDDREAAPLLLYVGEKDTSEGADLLARNGLSNGKLYVWKPEGGVGDSPTVTNPGDDGILGTADDEIIDGDTAPDPSGFNGTGNRLAGSWVELDYYRLDLASEDSSTGYDQLGFATQEKQDELFLAAGGFQFSRPEDVATNPENGTVAVLASTGREERFPEDSWGTTYKIDTDFDAEGNPVSAEIKILYDGDDAGNGQFATSDEGLRSPDNVDWAKDGLIYIQEDRSIDGFGLESGEEASIWTLDPDTGLLTRVAQMDRSAVPENQIDTDPTDIGDWESSGIIDVSTLFGETPGSLFLFDVQAHSLNGGSITDNNLVQGGQLAFLEAPGVQTELVGFASLPADTFAEGPDSGNFIDTDNRETPFEGQPVQGFSGVQFAPGSDDTFWFLSDNGFGSQDNSTDYLLRIYQVDPDFATTEGGTGEPEVQGFIQLADPNNLILWDIVNEGTTERLLTGADFDVESIVIDRYGDIWIGDEFGPYLLNFDADGTLLSAPIPTANLFELNTLNGQTPLVIGHRGASGERPEHTLEAYQLAMEQGADFVEPDLVITSDGVLIARHEPLLDDTTNVAEIFGEDRKSTKMLDGVEVTGYFAEDFTLAEIKQLGAVQSRDYRDQSFNGQFEIPTFEEVIQLVKDYEAETGKKIGIYPETKHPTFFDEQGLSLEEPLIQTLLDTGFTDPNRIFIQSFEVQNLIELKNELLPAVGLENIPLVQLFGDISAEADPTDSFSYPYDFVVNAGKTETELRAIYGDLVDLIDFTASPTYEDLANPEVIEYISGYAGGLGPWKNNILLREPLDEPVDGNGDGVAEITTQLTGEIFPLVEWAHNAGLQVHPYTMRNEERFLTLNPDGTPQTPEDEFKQLIEIGFDGYFTDFPATGDFVRDQITQDYVASPQNPEVKAGDLVANLGGSGGFEGMASSPDGLKLYPLLEKTVVGDPSDALRIYEFDINKGEYNGLLGFYGKDDANHAIGDFTPINNHEFLIIERDNGQGESAQFKKIFKIDISEIDEHGYVEKEEVADLLNIADPNDLNGDGSTFFDFPFVTIEDILVIDKNTILVANDNNYPFSIGRGPDIDNNEMILLELPKPLHLSPYLIADEIIEGTILGDNLEGGDTSDLINGRQGPDLINGNAGDDFLRGQGHEDTINGGSGNDKISGGDRNDILNGGAGNDRIHGGKGKDIIDGGDGNDRLIGQALENGDLTLTDTELMGNGTDTFTNIEKFTLRGGEGDNLLSAEAFTLAGVWINGKEGNDTLMGGLANDTLTGGEGTDIFVLMSGMGKEIIKDFEHGIDKLALTEDLSFADLTIKENKAGTGTLVKFEGEVLAVLRGFDVDLITENDFIFM